jgi:hypothetical protein
LTPRVDATQDEADFLRKIHPPVTRPHHAAVYIRLHATESQSEGGLT